MKEEMKERDMSRDKANVTDDMGDWEEYRRRRNSCIVGNFCFHLSLWNSMGYY